MAKLLTMINPSTEESTEVYCIPAQININRVAKTGMVTFLCYASKKARDLGLTPIGQHIYVVTEDLFAEFFESGVTGTSSSNLSAQAYAMAVSVKDQLVNKTPTMEQEQGGSLAKVSFFEGATDC